MTRLSFLLALLVLSACASSSESQTRDDDRVAQTLASLDQAVDLTDAQAARVREILVAQQAARPSGPPPRGGQGGPPRGQGGDRDAQRAETNRQIEAVLTEDQVNRYRTWQASQPQRPQGPPPRGQ